MIDHNQFEIGSGIQGEITDESPDRGDVSWAGD